MTVSGFQQHIVAFEYELGSTPVVHKDALEILEAHPDTGFRAVLVCARTRKVRFWETTVFRRMNGEGDPRAFLAGLSSRLIDAKPSIVR